MRAKKKLIILQYVTSVGWCNALVWGTSNLWSMHRRNSSINVKFMDSKDGSLVFNDSTINATKIEDETSVVSNDICSNQD